MFYRVDKIDILGQVNNRRGFLKQVGIETLEGLTQVGLAGAALGSIGFGDKLGGGHPFAGLPGFADFNSSTLVLASGNGLYTGPFANPLLRPALLHGVSLEQLNVSLVNLAGLSELIFKTPGQIDNEKVAEFFRSQARMAQVWVKDGNSYKVWDLAKVGVEAPSISVSRNAELEISANGQKIVSKEDRVYLRGLYHPDVNRFDPGAFVGICEVGAAPTQSKPIAVMELQTPLIASGEPMNITEMLQEDNLSVTPYSQSDCETFIRNGKNVWRYGYKDGVFSGQCKAHGDKPNEEWEEMGARLFYEVTQRGRSIELMPEPDLKSSFNISQFGIKDRERVLSDSYMTGMVLYSIKDGKPDLMRTNLTNLARQNYSAEFNGTNLILRDKDGVETYFGLHELRSKPYIDQRTFDGYFFQSNGATQQRVRVGPLGSFDIMDAYERGQSWRSY